MQPAKVYDVIVIGAGHAGIEAALAAARMGCHTLCITSQISTIGKMSCNPAIGGPAKSHLVFEIDALGGYMGWAADKTALQLKMLNTSKGPAVWSLRAQSDMYEYQKLAQHTLLNTPNLTVAEDLVDQFTCHDNKKSHISGVIGASGLTYQGKTVVVTTGTFMRGLLHTGMQNNPGGRVGERPSNELSDSFKNLGIALGRLKTGTPPRLHRDSIAFDRMKCEPGDDNPYFFSTRTDSVECPNVPCHLTYTSEYTHQIIRANIHQSPMYSGKIEGVGPRYCPSIEDKVVKFADKPMHQIFVEPTGRDHVEYYPAGFSSSLPADVQLAAIRTLPGLEQVEFIRPGYAVEYDFVFPHQLKNNFEVQTVEGLFCAGQICGTSGYEEAAAQGLYAGINAALKAKQFDPFLLPRNSSYIGTLIDDLITKEITEPYRMFTGRSEFRLILRQDNADLRLTPLARPLGLVSDEQWKRVMLKTQNIDGYNKKLTNLRLNPDQKTNAKLTALGVQIKNSLSLAELLRRPEVSLSNLIDLGLIENSLDRMTHLCLETEIKYDGFIKRQNEQLLDIGQLDRYPIPIDLRYSDVNGLRKEAALKLQKLLPSSLGQASRIAGVNPSDITVLMFNIRKHLANTQKS